MTPSQRKSSVDGIFSLMEKSKQRNFNLKLCSYVAQMIFRVLWNFQQQWLFPSRDTECCKKVGFGQVFAKCGRFFWVSNISTRKHPFCVKISGWVEDYETYLWAKFQIEITIFWFFTRPDSSPKGHCISLAEKQGNSV